MNALFSLIMICVILCLSACSVHKRVNSKDYIYIQEDGRAFKKNWKLVWKDDFNGHQLDTSKWSRIPVGGSDWNRHMSLQEDLVFVKDGHVTMLGVKNSDKSTDPRPYLTGGIWSKNKFAFQYGRIEIRAKLGSAQGAWPAMWMLAELDKYGNYPMNGEIDIMEHINFESKIYQTTHSHYTLNLKQVNNPPHGGTAAFDPNEYHVFGLSWYPDKLVFQLDGKNTFTYPRVQHVDKTQWPYDQPFYILIDQQLGGSWVGEVNLEHLPVKMEVDWVKVYQ